MQIFVHDCAITYNDRCAIKQGVRDRLLLLGNCNWGPLAQLVVRQSSKSKVIGSIPGVDIGFRIRMDVNM